MKPTHIIIHYAEIALKGNNRIIFERQLIKNIKLALADLGIKKVNRLLGRIVIPIPEGLEPEKIAGRLSKIFGIVHFSFAVETKNELDQFKQTALELARANSDWQTFKIVTKRSNKLFPITSMEVSREIGAFVLEQTENKKVDVKKPDLKIEIEIIDKQSYVYAGRIAGPGGLPVGTSGRVVSLLSGGIDSPVASWKLMKRGCENVFVHFHSLPQTDRASVEKVKELAGLLSAWQSNTIIYLVPFLDIQKAIVQETKGDYRVVLYRRFMYRIAEAIARDEKIKALVTGESVGQVASQTLDNIETINAAISIPVLRPLIGSDKIEIIDEAKKINTYELSIVPHGDCCSLFVPRHPVTKAKIHIAEAEEAKLDVEKLIQDAITNTETITL